MSKVDLIGIKSSGIESSTSKDDTIQLLRQRLAELELKLAERADLGMKNYSQVVKQTGCVAGQVLLVKPKSDQPSRTTKKDIRRNVNSTSIKVSQFRHVGMGKETIWILSASSLRARWVMDILSVFRH
ncbi:hypothetical protein HUJ04_005434 [Dendroctonus ponderosae]|nr:hypothetical protein HUJ04_005434 [Dendroctonus ponderosae]